MSTDVRDADPTDQRENVRPMDLSNSISTVELRELGQDLDPERRQELQGNRDGLMQYLDQQQQLLDGAAANNELLARTIRSMMTVARNDLVGINNQLRPLPSLSENRQAADVLDAVKDRLHELYTLGPDESTEDDQPGLTRPLDAEQFLLHLEVTLAHMRQHGNPEMRQLLDRLDLARGRPAPVDRDGNPLETAQLRAANLAFESSGQGGEGCEVAPAAVEVMFGPISAADGDGGGAPVLHGTTLVTSAQPPCEFVFVLAYKDPSTAQAIKHRILRDTPESARRMLHRRLVVSVVHEETRERLPSTIPQIDDEELRGQMTQLHLRRQQFLRQAEDLDSSCVPAQYICARLPLPPFCHAAVAHSAPSAWPGRAISSRSCDRLP